MTFETRYTIKVLKNLYKYKKRNKKVYEQIVKGIAQIEENPFQAAKKQLESIKCPKCRRHKVGDYRIVYYIHTKSNIIEIQNVIPRKSNYDKY